MWEYFVFVTNVYRRLTLQSSIVYTYLEARAKISQLFFNCYRKIGKRGSQKGFLSELSRPQASYFAKSPRKVVFVLALEQSNKRGE